MNIANNVIVSLSMGGRSATADVELITGTERVRWEAARERLMGVLEILACEGARGRLATVGPDVNWSGMASHPDLPYRLTMHDREGNDAILSVGCERFAFSGRRTKPMAPNKSPQPMRADY